MRKSLKPNNMMFPMPVLLISTYNEDDSIDVMNAAWGTLEDSDVVLLELTEDHRTSQNIIRNKAFTIAYANKDNVVPSDYVGVVSNNQVKDKFEKTKWHAIKSELVNAPIIDELPVTIECELLTISTENDSFKVFGKIKGVSIDDTYLDEKGHLDISKCEFITYNSADHSYRVLGEKVADAFSIGLKLK